MQKGNSIGSEDASQFSKVALNNGQFGVNQRIEAKREIHAPIGHHRQRTAVVHMVPDMFDLGKTLVSTEPCVARN
jgi:hypothetical protein